MVVRQKNHYSPMDWSRPKDFSLYDGAPVILGSSQFSVKLLAFNRISMFIYFCHEMLKKICNFFLNTRIKSTAIRVRRRSYQLKKKSASRIYENRMRF